MNCAVGLDSRSASAQAGTRWFWAAGFPLFLAPFASRAPQEARELRPQAPRCHRAQAEAKNIGCSRRPLCWRGPEAGHLGSKVKEVPSRLPGFHLTVQRIRSRILSPLHSFWRGCQREPQKKDCHCNCASGACGDRCPRRDRVPSAMGATPVASRYGLDRRFSFWTPERVCGCWAGT